jgi:hypothetical protein
MFLTNFPVIFVTSFLNGRKHFLDLKIFFIFISSEFSLKETVQVPSKGPFGLQPPATF